MVDLPIINDVLNAIKLINPFINITPVLKSSAINKIFDCDIFFKCENFQKVGAFKFRGAINAILSSQKDELINGVATQSSGNHAQAIALAARIQNIPAYIVMPKDSPKVKVEAVRGYGASITFCDTSQKSREETLEKVIEETKAKFIHPSNDYKVIAGQGTATLEILEQVPNLDIIITPLGGGGLLSGTLLSAKYMNKNIKVFGAEPLNANDAYLSLQKGEIVPSINPTTICDGLRTSLGTRTFEIIKQNVDNIYTASEDSIISSMRLIWERMKIIIEPSSAVTLAIIKENPEVFRNKQVGIILSGGNVDLNNLPF